MGAQRLSVRSIRRIERSTGLRILRAWSHGGYVMGFVTPDHRHGWWDKKTGEFAPDADSDVVHYTSCDTTVWEADGPPIPDAAPTWRAVREREAAEEKAWKRAGELDDMVRRVVESDLTLARLRFRGERRGQS